MLMLTLLLYVSPHRANKFAEFSMKLEGLFTQYNIPGDKYLLLKNVC